MIAVKGPALGLSPQNYTRLLGRTCERIIEEDEPFLDRDLGEYFSLDMEHLLPMEYGFTVRFRDYEEMLALSAPHAGISLHRPGPGRSIIPVG